VEEERQCEEIEQEDHPHRGRSFEVERKSGMAHRIHVSHAQKPGGRQLWGIPSLERKSLGKKNHYTAPKSELASIKKKEKRGGAS